MVCTRGFDSVFLSAAILIKSAPLPAGTGAYHIHRDGLFESPARGQGGFVGELARVDNPLGAVHCGARSTDSAERNFQGDDILSSAADVGGHCTETSAALAVSVCRVQRSSCLATFQPTLYQSPIIRRGTFSMRAETQSLGPCTTRSQVLYLILP